MGKLGVDEVGEDSNGDRFGPPRWGGEVSAYAMHRLVETVMLSKVGQQRPLCLLKVEAAAR